MSVAFFEDYVKITLLLTRSFSISENILEN